MNFKSLLGWTIGLIGASLAPFMGVASAQVKCIQTGDIGGLRVNGQLLEFNASVRAVAPEWTELFRNERFNRAENGSFIREGQNHKTDQKLDGLPLHYTTDVTDAPPSEAKVIVEAKASAEIPLAGLYYCIELPADTFSHGSIELLDSVDGHSTTLNLEDPANLKREILHARAKGLRIQSEGQQLEISATEVSDLIIRRDAFTRSEPPAVQQTIPLNKPQNLPAGAGARPAFPRTHLLFSAGAIVQPNDPYQIYFVLSKGNLSKDQIVKQTFSIKASVQPDKDPISFAIDPSQPGHKFDGISGNFRLQFPDKDPPVIDYCLDNLRVSWGRIAMWWNLWQPDANVDPVAEAKAGRRDPNLYRQMELARRLTQKKIPVIVSIWFPPKWAATAVAPKPRSVQLDPEKVDAICSSIGKYLMYLKTEYGVEAALFSFNEPDTGVSVLTTPEEHAFWAKQLGSKFAALGLPTRFLLGDTAQGTIEATKLLEPAMADLELRPYVGAVAFHTYRGCSDTDLTAWKNAATRAHVPLLVTEASLDGGGHMYPAIFTEDWFQLYEADLMINICGKTQAQTMMVWQLTSDYSPLAGGGIYGDNGPLHPTMRFWFLKQLGSTPPGAFSLPISADRARVSCAAYEDIANGQYAIHLVNTGATRDATLSGLPANLKEMHVYYTDTTRGMQEGAPIKVENGVAHFSLETATFTSLFGNVTR